jgi:hypothetical protein
MKRGLATTEGKMESAYRDARKSSPIATSAGEFAGETGATLPFFGAGGAATNMLARMLLKQAPKLGRAAGGIKRLGKAATATGLGSAGVGASQYVNEGESRLENTLTGGGVGTLFGAGTGVAGGVGKKAYELAAPRVKKLLMNLLDEPGFTPDMVEEIYNTLNPKDIVKTLANARKARKKGITLTPAEASGSTLAHSLEQNVGKTDRGAKKLIERKTEQKSAQSDMVDSFLDEVDDTGKSYARGSRDALATSLEDARKARSAKAFPIYEAIVGKEVPFEAYQRLWKNEILKKHIGKVLTDVDLKPGNKGFAPNSVQILNTAKKSIDIAIKEAKGKNPGVLADPEKLRNLVAAKKKLVNSLEKHVPEYKTARKTFELGSPEVDLLSKGAVGKIAKMDDSQLKLVSQRVFDPKETDPAAFEKIYSSIYKQDPLIWRGLVRNEMDRLINSMPIDKTQAYGSRFYNAILKDDRVYKRFMDSLSSLPEAKKSLSQMRPMLRSLENNYGGAGAVKSKPTTAWSEARDMANAIVGGKYDAAMVELITSGKWVEEVQKLHRSTMSQADKEISFMKLVGKVAKTVPAAQATTSLTQSQGG